MNNHELVVRIIQPAEQPQPQKKECASAAPKKKEKGLFQAIVNGMGIAAIAALGIFLAFSFFNVGFSFKDVLILIGIPLAVGVVASYAIF
jgi:hypothetical protein